MPMIKGVLILFVSTLVFGIVIGYFFGYDQGAARATRAQVSSFEECKAAGYLIMEKYPEECLTPDGRSFTRIVDTQPIEESDNTPPSHIGGEGWGVPDPITPSPQPVACTMDAKLCPDGSAVGRTGPDCEFPPCPGE